MVARFFVFTPVDAQGKLHGLHHVFSLTQEVQGQLILEQQEEVHVNIQLLKFVFVAVLETPEQLCVELEHFRMLVAIYSDNSFTCLPFELVNPLLDLLGTVLVVGGFEHGLLFYVLTFLVHLHWLKLMDP